MASEQVAEIQRVMNQVASSNLELVKSVDSVSSVVEENTAATEEMLAGANEVKRAAEAVAAVSEENSAAAEEVSASTEEMSAQVEEMVASTQTLAQMAEDLREVVARFKLEEEGARTEVVLKRRKTDWEKPGAALRPGKAAKWAAS